MDDIKKFKDFLDRMRGFIDIVKEQGHTTVRVEELEKTFPELKESEDERIRKELLEHCKNQAEPYILTGNKYPQIQSWIDWLEKQGDINRRIQEEIEKQTKQQWKSENHALKSFNDEDVRKFMQYIEKQAKAYEFNLPNRSYDIYAFAKDILNWLENQDEQNPITFNDDHIIDSALNDYCCKQYSALHKENGGVLSFARLQHLAMDIYGWCKKQNKQNHSWTEEDEKILNLIIARLHSHPNVKSEEYDNEYNWLNNWLPKITKL